MGTRLGGKSGARPAAAMVVRIILPVVFVMFLMTVSSCAGERGMTYDRIGQEYDPAVDGIDYADDYDDYYYDYMGY